MQTVTIREHDESFIQVTSERGVMLQISDFFTFYVPNFQFNPKYRDGFWDGKIHLYNTKTYLLYKGLLRQLLDLCEEQGWDVDCYKEPTHIAQLSTAEFLSNLETGVNADGNKRVPFDFQMKSLDIYVNDKRALILSSTGSGKSLIQYMCARYTLEANIASKILIVVPSIGLVTQLFKDFVSYAPNNDGEWANTMVHKIHGGLEKHTDKPITVSTWQSLQDMPRDYFEQFDCVFVDECHKAKSDKIKYIMESCINAKYRLGMTGTLDSSVTHKMVLEGLFAPFKRVSSVDDLASRGILADVTIYCVRLQYKQRHKHFGKGLLYPDEIEFIEADEARNEYIAKVATGLTGNNLLLVSHIEHADLLIKLIEKHGKKAFLVTGNVSINEREDIKEMCSHSSNIIMVATYGVFSTGVNIVELNNLIFASPLKAEISVLQSIGRTLRVSSNKTTAKVIDVIDDMSCGRKKKNYCVKHFLERHKYYTREKFKVKHTTIEI